MTKWYCIPPGEYCEDMSDWMYHMIIAPHMRANVKYYEFYMKHRELYTLLDNGLWEGEVLPDAEILEWAQLVEANEIIAPDDKSGRKTVEMTDKFIQYLRAQHSRDEYLIHGAIHGKDIKEMTSCLHSLYRLGVDVLDLPKMLGPQNRAIMLRVIKEEYPLMPVHYLGYYKEEFEMLQHNTLIRSFDSSVPFKPKYEDKFDLNLPKTMWNDWLIHQRTTKFMKLFNE